MATKAQILTWYAAPDSKLMMRSASERAIRAMARSTHWTLASSPAGGLRPSRHLLGTMLIAGIALLVKSGVSDAIWHSR